MALLTGYIQTGRLCNFIKTFLEEYADDKRWEFYLHHVFDRSYEDYKAEVETQVNNQSMTKRKMQSIVAKTDRILNNFSPEEGDNK